MVTPVCNLMWEGNKEEGKTIKAAASNIKRILFVLRKIRAVSAYVFIRSHNNTHIQTATTTIASMTST